MRTYAGIGLCLVVATATSSRVATPDTGPPGGREDRDTLLVFSAGSLARPLKALLDSFSIRERIVAYQENAGSLETARKIIDLHRVPDVVALADDDVFPRLLMPAHVTWYAKFARNRLVIVYADRSSGAAEITSANWWRILTRPGVEVGRADPDRDPAGYRTLFLIQLAARFYKRPALAADLLAAAPTRNMRPKSADLTALIETGELDYAWAYESVALTAGLRYVRLPEQLDLGEAADSAFYAQATVRVAGATPTDTVEFRGAPIVCALSIPLAAPHARVAERFVAFAFSGAGRRILRAEKLDVLDYPLLIGAGVPAAIVRAQAGSP